MLDFLKSFFSSKAQENSEQETIDALKDTGFYSPSGGQKNLSIGVPPKKPEVLINNLITYAEKVKVVKSIAVAQLYDDNSGTRLCLAIEFVENIDNKPLHYCEMSKLAQATLSNGEYIDFDEKGRQIGDLVFEYGVRIYKQ